MGDIQFPSIQEYSFEEDITPEEPGIGHEPEDGMEITRPRFSRTRTTYNRHWNAMPEADFLTFKNFYDNTIRGKSLVFVWNGVRGRIAQPYIAKRVSVSPNLYYVSVVFREA